MNTLDDTTLHRLRRKASVMRHKSILPMPTFGPIVSFGFDDCPVSAIETGLPLLEAQGWHATIYVAVGLCDTVNHLGRHMSRQDIVDVHARGHEIADHTFSHINAKVSPDIYLADIERNQTALAELGLPPSRNFAYPFGDVTTPIKRSLRKTFRTGRGVTPPKSSQQDANFLSAMPIYTGGAVQAAIDRIATLNTSPAWLNLFTHDVSDAPSPFGCRPDDLKDIIAAVKASGARVMTVDAACDALKSESGSA